MGIEVQGDPEHKWQYLDREKIKDLGLEWYDLKARGYESVLGRFHSVDPLPDAQGQEGLSTYQYGWNNPILLSDPNGDCPKCPIPTYAINIANTVSNYINKANSRAKHYNYLEQKISGIEPSFLSKAHNYAAAYLKQGVGNYSDANDAAVLTKGQNLDGSRATTGDRVSAGIGMFIPVIGGKALKELVQGAGEGLQYVLKSTDLDLRKAGVKFNDALDAAFKATGVDRGDFEVTKWGKNQYGKSVPVEYRAKGGAEISIDYAHKNNGLSPDAPHIGWQTAGKGKSQSSGHIILDNVPSGRSADKLDRSQY